MAERLAGGNVAITLLANTLATVGALYILIEVFGPVSGAHMNPAVSIAFAVRGELTLAMLAAYVACATHRRRRGCLAFARDVRAADPAMVSQSHAAELANGWPKQWRLPDCCW